ncbi:MAG: hypothetical protein H6957_01910 [Chromatiaceae bacterium]|nr:hypothetical protein [Chromatiaceae bacterium]
MSGHQEFTYLSRFGVSRLRRFQINHRHLTQIMGLKTLLRRIQRRLPFGTPGRPTPCDHIRKILIQLKGRQSDLELKLSQEHLPAKRRRMELQLEVIRLQQAKGLARQVELRDGCD